MVSGPGAGVGVYLVVEEMKVLVACEFSGIVREAFNQRGHRATSADLLPTEIPGDHYQGDVLDILDQGWDLMIAHPPCTYLCNSGVRWLYNQDGTENKDRWDKMLDATDFFYHLLNSGHLHHIPKIAVENPIPHGEMYRNGLIGPYTQIIHPWQYGHSEKKSTCLWLHNLPKLIPNKFIDNRKNPVRKESIWKEPPGPNRQKNRSRTFPGIAAAMADQWGAA